MTRFLLLIAGLLAGCSTVQSVPEAGPPTDFALDVAVRPAAGSDTPAPARFIVLPDGLIHAEAARRRYGRFEALAADDPAVDARPGAVRRLAPPEMDRLWSAVEGLSLAPDAQSASGATVPPSGGVVVTVYANEFARSTVFEAGPDEALPPGVNELISYLRELGLVDEFPGDRRGVIPRRYDLGPDPWERYRSP